MKETGTGKKQMPLRISAALYDQLAAWAEEDFRSVNGQIEYLLTECVKQRNAEYCGKGFVRERCASMQRDASCPEYMTDYD